MPPRLLTGRLTRILGVFSLLASATVAIIGATSIGQTPGSPPPPECALIDTLRYDMQMNMRASHILVQCGREVGGREAEEFAQRPEPAAGTSPTGSNINVVTGTETLSHVTQSEHQIWANGSTVVITYNDSRDAPNLQYSGVSYSTDGGKTYTRIVPSPFATGHGGNYGDPTVVFNKKLNTWYVSFLSGGCGGQGIGLWTSANGINWSTGVCAHTGNGDDRQSMTVDNNPASPYYGRMYISWNNFALSNGPLTVTRSDNGTTWTPVTVYSAAFRRDVQIGVAENGTVLLAGMNEGGGGANVRQNTIYRSTDGGVSFSSEITLGATFTPPCDFTSGYFRICNPIWRHMGWGDIATGASNVAIYAYAADGAGTDTGDIYYVRSANNGANWSAPVRIDGTTENRTQWMPSVGGGGNYFLISWYDRKNTTTNDYERYGVISKDGGVNWSAPQRISDMIIPQPAQPDPNVQTYYAGDYMRTFFDGVYFYDGWTDGRIQVAAPTNQQDVFTQRIRLVSPVDFNADVKSDWTIFRPSVGFWYTALAGGGATSTGWGASGDIDVPGDYDGDGKTDIAVFRPSLGFWYIVQSSTGGVRIDSWGVDGDTPLSGDVDGDGKDDLGIFRPSIGTWYIKKSTGGFSVTSWGTNGDMPLLADYDNDGKADIAIYRPSGGVWYVLKSAGGVTIQPWGVSGDMPVVGDYDGDGKTDIGVFRPSSGAWYIIKSSNGSIWAVSWGAAGDTPVSGDQDGDGKHDFIVWRGSIGVWYTQFATGGFSVLGWGGVGDKPVGRVPGT